MELRILDERKNPLLHRVEYRFEVGHAAQATPTRDAVRQELSKMVKVPKDRLVVERMNARFGIAKSEGFAVAYETKEALDVTVPEHILVRNGLREKAVKAGAPATAEPEVKAEATPLAAAAAPKADVAVEPATKAPPKAKPAQDTAPKKG